MNRNLRVGSSLDDLLKEDGMLEELTKIALRRIKDWKAKSHIIENRRFQ